MLPTLDEEGALEDIYRRIPIEELKQKGYTTRVVVVDGGSNDNTVKIAVDLAPIKNSLLSAMNEAVLMVGNYNFSELINLFSDDAIEILELVRQSGAITKQQIIRILGMSINEFEKAFSKAFKEVSYILKGCPYRGNPEDSFFHKIKEAYLTLFYGSKCVRNRSWKEYRSYYLTPSYDPTSYDPEFGKNYH